ncbi:hypothetical protein SAMN05216371_8208 [Streptomyces sp. TLI_053]|uniref:hypothetical protein n=1 Tax=Streptomyces sp. TLI_053 TaxID=1855352 RepID=UPI00087A9B76|nr:hypothetical protein [Streptomyces sp. TLI_053]SDT83385.1 hypothetical protein SAMN05216371_8208 [Streptomyces sp. TLI_053]
MFGRTWVKAALVVVASLVALLGAMVALYVLAWWQLGSEDPYSKPAAEIVRHTPEQFHALSDQAVRDTVGGLSPALVLSDRGRTVDRYEPRTDGKESKLSTVERRFTVRTRIGASHRQELREGIEADWRLHGFLQVPPALTSSAADEGREYLSAATSEGIRVSLAFLPEPDGTLTLTMSVSGTDIAYDPDYARPLSPLRPDTEDTYWSH